MFLCSDDSFTGMTRGVKIPRVLPRTDDRRGNVSQLCGLMRALNDILQISARRAHNSVHFSLTSNTVCSHGKHVRYILRTPCLRSKSYEKLPTLHMHSIRCTLRCIRNSTSISRFKSTIRVLKLFGYL